MTALTFIGDLLAHKHAGVSNMNEIRCTDWVLQSADSVLLYVQLLLIL